MPAPPGLHRHTPVPPTLSAYGESSVMSRRGRQQPPASPATSSTARLLLSVADRVTHHHTRTSTTVAAIHSAGSSAPSSVQRWLETQQVPPPSYASSHVQSVVTTSTCAELHAALPPGAEAALLPRQTMHGSQLSHATQRTRRSRQSMVSVEAFTRLADNLVQIAGQQRDDAVRREDALIDMKSDAEKGNLERDKRNAERERLQLEIQEREPATERDRLLEQEKLWMEVEEKERQRADRERGKKREALF